MTTPDLKAFAAAIERKPSDFDARLGSACFDLEPTIRELRLMAGIAVILFEKLGAPDSKGEWFTIQISKEEFERLEFAVRSTSIMAGDFLELGNDGGLAYSAICS
jgi:hypothetical protein